MKLLFVSEATGWTGGTNQIVMTAKRLIDRGHEVAVACDDNGELARKLKDNKVPLLPFKLRQDYDFIGAWRLARLARDWGANLLHAHHPRAHALVLLACFLLNSPMVVTRRVITPVGRNPFSRFKYGSTRVNRYIAVCDAAADELGRAGVEKERIRVIPSGVDIDRWKVCRESRAALRAVRPPTAVLVGHYSAFKGHDVLLRALPLVRREFPDIRLRLVGRGTQDLKPLAERLGVLDNVELMGPRTDIPGILAKAHLFVLPSLQEGIGTALIEAQAGLVPVVASEVGGLPQVVEKDRTGLLVPPGNVSALADAMIRQLSNPDRAEVMAAAGYERVCKLFSIESAVDRLEEIYQDLAAA